MTDTGATGTHTGRYDQLFSVPEISQVDHPQLEPIRAAHGPSTAVARASVVGRDDDALAGSEASPKPFRAPGIADAVAPERRTISPVVGCGLRWAAQLVAVGRRWPPSAAAMQARCVSHSVMIV